MHNIFYGVKSLLGISLEDKLFTEYLSEARGKIRTIDGTPDLDDLVKAVTNREYIGIYYEDENADNEVLQGFRLIEPYAVGKGYVLNGKVVDNDNYYLRAFVVKDSNNDQHAKSSLKKLSRRKSKSLSKVAPYWRIFRIDRIQSWMPLKRKFSGYRKLYNPNDKTLKKIIKSLQKEDFPRGVRKSS